MDDKRRTLDNALGGFVLECYLLYSLPKEVNDDLLEVLRSTSCSSSFRTLCRRLET